MPPKSPTAPSTPRLSEFAREFVFPQGVITKTVWPRVEAKGLELGLGFDWWQSQLGTVCLGYGKDGKYAATVGGIGLSIPRQVGKTYFVLALLVVMCILFPGLQVVWTSHHLRTTNKTFTALRGMCRRRKIAPHVRSMRTANGEGQVDFTNGSVIMFGARSQGFGRGFDEIDVEVFDEAQILDTKSLEDMVAATNQARHPYGALLFFMGTPPRPSDPSEAFANRRDKAINGKATNAVWLEIGADPTSDPDDRSQWPLMNPSHPLRTPTESIERLRENLGDDDSWNREGRGIWDSAQSNGVIPPGPWADREDVDSVPVDAFTLGLEVGPDLAWASVALAGKRADEAWHIALEADQHTVGKGAAWLTPHVEALVEANPQIRGVVVDVGGPIKALLTERNGRWLLGKVEVTPLKVAELGAGCSTLLAGVVAGEVFHLGQPQLTSAALAASKRALGDTGMWVWHRKAATSDITPIQACTYALVGAQMVRPKKPFRASGSNQGEVAIL